MSITKDCKNCGAKFEIEDEDLQFYEKISPEFNGKKYLIPPPTFCPTCRHQRRIAFRNERSLYKRTCDFSKKNIISMYSQDKPYKIYDQEVWWSDKWDPMEYGRDYDFNKPFFEQLVELQKVVPRMSLNVINSENSYFTNYAFGNKDSYLLYTADYNEECLYGRFSNKNYNCVDFNFTYDCTQCYEVIDVKKCTKCFFSQKCDNSSELYFCYDMKNCHNCMFSTNLRNKSFYIFNKQVTEEEFNQFKNEISSYENLQQSLQKAREFIEKQPHKYLEIVNCENCIGDYLRNSKNAKYCYDSFNLQDVKYATNIFDCKDCYDWDFVSIGSELCYEMVSSAIQMYNCKFTMNSWEGNQDLYYCDLCLGNKNLFGCVSLRKKEYCILNKQYTKEQYEELVPKIIEHMKSTGEWGEFLSAKYSPFAYNETIAQDYFPLTKEQVASKGWEWKDPDKKEYVKSNYEIADDIKDVPDNITAEMLQCEECGKNYRIIPLELKFYKEMGIPVPRKCPDCRYKNRIAKRNPRKIYDRKCMKEDCNKEIQTTYAPEKPEQAYCDECYNNSIY